MHKEKNTYEHIPVLLPEVLSCLRLGAGENVVDATLGGSGYSLAILDRIGSTGHLLSIDLDQDAIKNAENIKHKHKYQNWTIAHSNFTRIDHIIRNHKFPAPNGIAADLGMSSHQLDGGERGISFQKKELLDMRFDARDRQDAKFILNTFDQHQLEKIFKELGEEKFSKQIAKKIVENRNNKSPFAKASGDLRYTTDLYQIIESALPKPVKHRADDSARRIFQALRIAVNHELENLQEFLPKAFDVLAPGGRMAIVSFHSLEDRMVKQFFVGLAKGCICPIDFPQCVCGRNAQAKVLTKKPIVATEPEIKINPRSKPAKLRAIVKI